ncbi:MAG: hypothetical protein ACSW8E_05205 [Clostridia bacterium]
MYCMQCGVELQKGVEKCPLCGLRVFHPSLTEQPEPLPYPRRAGEESVSRRGILFIVSVLFLLPVLICLQIDLRLNGRIGWSGVVAFSLLAAWLMFCLPLWFRRRNPVIFFPIGMAAALGLCLYLCLKSGGRWFLPFAFPVGGAVLLIAEAVIVLLRCAVGERRRRALFVFGGAFLAAGGLCVLIEFLLRVSFGIAMRWWSLIPLTALALLGLALIVIGACRPLRLSLHKKFFL